jgi:N-acyl-D-amino-acid deacylase
MHPSRFVALSLLLWFVPALTGQELDLLIRGGRVIDGSGRAAFRADVGIQNGRIVAVGEIKTKARQEIDCADRVIAPGFIDVHTHSENILTLPQAENFLRMGVTTIVTGNCGGSKLRVGEFFQSLETNKVALNVATLIGHNTVRSQVMGGSFRRPPTGDELEQMKQLVDDAMRDGAVGLSTGLIYLPGTFAQTDEIIALAKVAAAHRGIYVSHMRYENQKIFDALEELFRIAREARIPAEISHLKLSGPSAWGRAEEVLGAIERARKEGLEITHDQYAYTASSTGLSTLIPDEARAGGSKAFAERIADPEFKQKLIAQMKERLRSRKNDDYSYATIASFRKDRRLNGKSVREAARLIRGNDSLDDQIELIIQIELDGGASAVFHGMNETDLQTFLRHPMTMVASDGGPKQPGPEVPHPRSYGNNARVIERYVREFKVLTLEEAVRKMTSLPAQTFKLNGRGEIKIGSAADLLVFDPDKVKAPASYEAPHQYAEGFEHVLVNGLLVIHSGKLTGAMPGTPLRRSPM